MAHKGFAGAASALHRAYRAISLTDPVVALSFWFDFNSVGSILGLPLDFTPAQQSLLARHPLCRFVAALRALIENSIFPAIERRLDSVDVHRLKDVTCRAMDERGKQVDHAREWL
jgi:hypothetical protein